MCSAMQLLHLSWNWPRQPLGDSDDSCDGAHKDMNTSVFLVAYHITMAAGVKSREHFQQESMLLKRWLCSRKGCHLPKMISQSALKQSFVLYDVERTPGATC